VVLGMGDKVLKMRGGERRRWKERERWEKGGRKGGGVGGGEGGEKVWGEVKSVGGG